jgi:hypothetical protein
MIKEIGVLSIVAVFVCMLAMPVSATVYYAGVEYLPNYWLSCGTYENEYQTYAASMYVAKLKDELPGEIDGDYVACGATAEYIGTKLIEEVGHEVEYNLYRKTGTNMMHVTVVDTTIGVEYETVSPAFTDSYNTNTGNALDYRSNIFDRGSEFTIEDTYDSYSPIGDSYSSGSGGVYSDTLTDGIIGDANSGSDNWLDTAREEMEGLTCLSTSLWAGWY